MEFNIESAPPAIEILEQERNLLQGEIKRLSTRDTVITFVLMVLSSGVLGLIVFWQSNNLTYTGIAIALFPILGTLLSLLGITKSTGFRSAANRINELQNELIAVSPIPNTGFKDLETLCGRHKLIKTYHEKVEAMDRPTVNAELAMYWEFDASTMANTARGRDMVQKAKDRIVS